MSSINCPVSGNLALAPSFDATRASILEYRPSSSRSVERFEKNASPLHAASAVIIVAALVLIFVAIALHTFSSQSSDFENALSSTAQVEIYVRSGDSLWNIAVDHPIEGLTTDEAVDVIREWNDLTSATLFPGSSIIVPA